jgi:hypothetical protein
MTKSKSNLCPRSSESCGVGLLRIANGAGKPRPPIGNNREERMRNTLCHVWGRNSNNFYDINDQKPNLTSVPGIVKVVEWARYVVGKQRENLDPCIGNNKEEKKLKTQCDERGNNSYKFYDINNLKPYLISVAVVVRSLGSALYPWSYVGTVSIAKSQRHSCQPATFLAPYPAVMPNQIWFQLI